MTIVNGTQITVYYIAVSYTALMILCTMLHCTAMRLHDNALRCNTSRYNVQYYSKLALQCHRSMPASQMIIPKATVMHRTIIHHTAMASHRKHQSSAAINGRYQRLGRPPPGSEVSGVRLCGLVLRHIRTHLFGHVHSHVYRDLHIHRRRNRQVALPPRPRPPPHPPCGTMWHHDVCVTCG